ncbi:MAG TPA: histidinol-phosphate transaminase [Verrucomicrobiae bacterium]|nr:histidinol-phosphate transaminase [Verrucomicrobiae bacterium]
MEFSLDKLIQPAIRDFKPYEAKNYPGVIKLDANENPFAWPEGLKERILDQVGFNRYPDPEAKNLRDKISGYTGVYFDNIMVGNGSDELIQMLLMAFGGVGTKTVVATPTFTMYSLATRYTGGQVVEVPLTNGDTLNVEGMLQAAADPAVRLVIICNPNNPTGNAFPLADIKRVIEGTDKLVIVDEAYFEFAGNTLAGELNSYPNLVVLRTFSKAFGMAGLRIGYLMAGLPVINVLQRVRQPYNSNTFSQMAGVCALEFLPQFQNQVEQILAERDRLLSFLQGLKLERVYATDANFILFKPVGLAQQLFQRLLEEKVLIRYMGKLPVVGETLRVSVGLHAENSQFIETLSALM